MASYGDTVIHIDPVKDYADYHSLPKADIVLITHEHEITTTAMLSQLCQGRHCPDL